MTQSRRPCFEINDVCYANAKDMYESEYFGYA